FQRLIKKTCENYEGFEKLEFRYTTEEDLNEIYRAYQKFDDIKEFPGRQEWEIAAIKYLNEQYINVGKEIDRDKKLLELMHFATAAHHYNMAACISKT
ncbi:MAG: hypothetical protein GTO02_01800, partial [Candidatus Dadabacteria bacterium]|nr:hypothetical protein [Candidatus Dadabacteria bacterium]